MAHELMEEHHMAEAFTVRYVGPHTEGVFVEGQYVAHGDPYETSHDAAANLLEQVENDAPLWEAVGKKPPKKRKSDAPEEPEAEQEK